MLRHHRVHRIQVAKSNRVKNKELLVIKLGDCDLSLNAFKEVKQLAEPLQIESIVSNSSPILGKSHPIMIIASDQQKYFLKRQVVKFIDKKNGSPIWLNEDAVFFQEWVVSQLARKLEIPTPETVLIDIDKETLEYMPELRFQYHISEGRYFATKLISDNDSEVTRLAHTLLQQIQMKMPYARTQWNALMKKIINVDDIPKIIGLDLYTLNYDRFSNVGNVLLQKAGSNRYLIAIDFGHCFEGPFWVYPQPVPKNMNKVSLLHQNLIDFSDQTAVILLAHQIICKYNQVKDNTHLEMGIVFDSLIRLIDFSGINPFEEIVSKIEAITEQELVSLLQSVPDEWVVAPGIQQQEYKAFLLRQKWMLRLIINEFADYKQFPTISGREALTWQAEPNMNIQ